ncbi:MAG: putative RND superfamily exporter protein [Sulfitobacter sp.]
MNIRFFQTIIRFRVAVLAMGLTGVLVAASFLPGLTRDTSSDAFIPADNPARVYREQVKDIFGLADPIIVGVFRDGEHGVFTPEVLQLVEALSLQVQDLPNVDPERVVSIATENNIEGTADGMRVDPFFEDYPDNALSALAIWQKVQDFPLYLGSLVARDGNATLIVAEVLDESAAEQTYLDLMELVNNTDLPDGVTVHVAGEASVTGYMGMYIDSDAQRLNPIAGLIITVILFLAFRTIAGAILPNLIVAATVLGTVGLMVASGVSFFVITNAMPVVLIGIAVADSIHIFSAYYETISDKPSIRNDQAVIAAMVEMWRPITLTTLTTIAGFLGLYISSVQPPMQYLGLFTAFGVGIAWLYSMTILPAAMSFLKINPEARHISRQASDIAINLMTKVGLWVVLRPKTIVAIGLVFVGAGIVGASNVEVNDRRIEVFNEKEPVFIANEMINDHFDGTSVFDIMIETDRPEALFRPDYLRKIESFQREIERHAIVGGTTSVVDYLKQMNRSLNEGNPDEYRLVDNEVLNAQLFLLYSTSGDPTDFEEEIDYDYQRANVRVNLQSASYQELKPLVAALNQYIATEFNEPGLTATLSGRAMITYEWVDGVGKGHFKSVLVSLALVFLTAVVVFRSVAAGLISLAPVAISILFVYATMALLGIDIGIGTSMFASVAIGLGVDFAIHTIDRIRILYADGDDSDETMLALFPSTGRALFFNLLAISCGFGVLMISDVVPLMRFGAIVALSVSTAFVFSLTFLPAIILLVRPKFIYATSGNKGLSGSSIAGLLIVVAIGLVSFAFPVHAEEITARQIMARVVARDDGLQVTRTLSMELMDRRGKSRTRTTRGYRKYFGDDKRTVLFYLSPTNVKDTAFLTYDYAESAQDDDQWLYLPAARKIRRISASDRGDYFLGTDFSYEDIKNENKPNLADYAYKRIGMELVGGVECFVIEGTPISDQVARELGYGRVLIRVDPEIWMARKTEFWDIKGNSLKTILVNDIRLVDDIWTSHELYAENHKTGHQTRFTFSDVDYKAEVRDSWFETRQMRRGL